MICVKRESVVTELQELDLEYASGIEKINDAAKADRATFRQKIADRRRKLTRLLDVLDTQPRPPVKDAIAEVAAAVAKHEGDTEVT